MDVRCNLLKWARIILIRAFHKIASGRDSYNLDTWLVPPHKLTPFFATMAHDVDLAIIEGVMGLYDGGREGVSSTAQIAKQLNAPVVLVIVVKLWVKVQPLLLKGSVTMTQR